MLRRASSLIGTRQDPSGQLAEVRFTETHYRPSSAFTDQAVASVRRITSDSWQLWQPRQNNAQNNSQNNLQTTDAPSPALSSDWVVVAEGIHDFGSVPVITFCVSPTGFMRWRPPLMDLAWLNLAHWQSASDQRHILHVARVPVLFGRALQMGSGELEIGPNRLILSDDPAADLKFVEHSGAAIAAGRRDLSDLEDQMAVMGLDLMMRHPAPVTATARQLDSAQNHAALAGMVRHLEAGLQKGLCAAARWLGLSPADAGTVCCDPAWLELPSSPLPARRRAESLPEHTSEHSSEHTTPLTDKEET